MPRRGSESDNEDVDGTPLARTETTDRMVPVDASRALKYFYVMEFERNQEFALILVAARRWRAKRIRFIELEQNADFLKWIPKRPSSGVRSDPWRLRRGCVAGHAGCRTVSARLYTHSR